jgi:hypothetical protein
VFYFNQIVSLKNNIPFHVGRPFPVAWFAFLIFTLLNRLKEDQFLDIPLVSLQNQNHHKIADGTKGKDLQWKFRRDWIGYELHVWTVGMDKDSRR